MRKPQEITIDRTLLVYGLHLAQEKECSMVSDVKVQQLIFLAELQMLGKGVRGLHYEFMRFPYGAFSKDLDNDLLALRKKERLQNFDVVGSAEDCIPLLDEEVAGEANEQVMEILQSIVETYGPQDVGEMSKSAWSIDPRKNYVSGIFRFIPSCLSPPESKSPETFPSLPKPCLF